MSTIALANMLGSDLYYVTFPLLVLILLYVFLSQFILSRYLLTFGKVKNKQLLAITRHRLKSHLAGGKIPSKVDDNEIIADRIHTANGNRNDNELYLGNMIEEDVCSVIIAIFQQMATNYSI